MLNTMDAKPIDPGVRIGHVHLKVADLERAVAFYGGTLGLRRSVYRPDRHHAEFEIGNLTLSIINPEGMGLEHHTSYNAIALPVRPARPVRPIRWT